MGRGPVAVEEAIVEGSGELRDVDSDAVGEGRWRRGRRSRGGVKRGRRGGGAEEEEGGEEDGDEGEGEEERRDGAEGFDGAGVLGRHLVVMFFAFAALALSFSLSESRTQCIARHFH